MNNGLTNGADGADLKNFYGLETELQVDTLERTKSYLLVSRSGAQIRVSASAYRLLQVVNSGRSLDELAREINSRNPHSRVAVPQLEKAYHDITSKLASIEERASKFRLPWAFWIKFRFLPGFAVRRISSFLSFAYQPYVCGALLIAIASAIFVMSRHERLAFSNGSLWWGYLLYLLSLILHEFGHSSACAWFGAPPNEIGFTIYLIYPAFYSDVSAAWQLTRWQRVVVDLGGNFFQLIAASVFVLTFYVTHLPAFQVAGLMILYSCVFSLNPFFKFDGYWVMADMLGVTNLARQPARIGKYFLARLRRRQAEPLPWPLSVSTVLVLYSVITTFVWVIFLYRLFPILWNRGILFFHQVVVMWTYLVAGRMPPSAEIRAAAVSGPMLLFGVIMVWNLAGSLYRFLVSRLIRPAKEAAAKTEFVQEL